MITLLHNICACVCMIMYTYIYMHTYMCILCGTRIDVYMILYNILCIYKICIMYYAYMCSTEGTYGDLVINLKAKLKF